MTKPQHTKSSDQQMSKPAEEVEQPLPDSHNKSEQETSVAADESVSKEAEQMVFLEQKLSEAGQEIGQLKDQLLRTLAESDNIRKRMQREKEDSQKFAVSNFAKDLIAVYDNLERALKNPIATEDPLIKNFIEGVTMTERQLAAVFEKHQLRRIVPIGEKFDGNQHQSVMEVLSSTQLPGTVAEVFQAGFSLHDRLLRPAIVTVVKAASKEEEAARKNQ